VADSFVLIATPSSPSWMKESYTVASVAESMSMPSVLRAVAGVLMSTPHTVRPVPDW
jgi:hypothetical protein